MKKQLTGEGGKGSSQRQTDKKKFDDSWDRIFGAKKDKEKSNVKNR